MRCALVNEFQYAIIWYFSLQSSSIFLIHFRFPMFRSVFFLLWTILLKKKTRMRPNGGRSHRSKERFGVAQKMCIVMLFCKKNVFVCCWRRKKMTKSKWQSPFEKKEMLKLKVLTFLCVFCNWFQWKIIFWFGYQIILFWFGYRSIHLKNE